MSLSDEVIAFNQPRLVIKKVLAKSHNDDEGVVIRKCVGRPDLKDVDPFVLLDHFELSPPAGFSDHPHRGFESVTYMFEGGLEIEDFVGSEGTIRSGDIQWMTAGRGIIHSEMPAGEGTHKGLQLWINLSSKHKMIEPKSQEVLNNGIPKAEKDGVKVQVIAGEALGVHSPVYTRTPTMILDFSLKPGAQLHQSIPESWNSFAYIIDGEGMFGSLNSSPAMVHHVLVFGSGDGLSVWNMSSKPLRFLLCGGQPLNEPVAMHVPFVMNTLSEIDQAIDDYRQSKNGFEKRNTWRSA